MIKSKTSSPTIHEKIQKNIHVTVVFSRKMDKGIVTNWLKRYAKENHIDANIIEVDLLYYHQYQIECYGTIKNISEYRQSIAGLIAQFSSDFNFK